MDKHKQYAYILLRYIVHFYNSLVYLYALQRLYFINDPYNMIIMQEGVQEIPYYDNDVDDEVC